MRYTYKRISGLLAIIIGIMLVSRFVPGWFFCIMLGVITLLMLYLIYYYSSY